jgi:hypothetical protein
MYPPTVVNAAGKALRTLDFVLPTGEFTIDVINNWRASHNHVLNVFYVTMSNRAKKVFPGAVTAQRIKRQESILAKLIRQPTMNLSQMQDIGGCRAIVRTIGQVRELMDIYGTRPMVHTLVGSKNYISAPKPDGYRGIHLIYRYQGVGPKAVYTGQRCEIQLRSDIQHVWATAVEAAGTFTKQALKSNQGREEWLRFFACVSSWFSFRENTPPVPGVPTNIRALREEIIDLSRTLHVVQILRSYTVTARSTGFMKHMKYFLVHLDPHAQIVRYTGYRHDQSEDANAAYTALESTLSGQPDAQAVLVSVDSIRALRRAYPNYFLDTSRFVREIEHLSRAMPKVFLTPKFSAFPAAPFPPARIPRPSPPPPPAPPTRKPSTLS